MSSADVKSEAAVASDKLDCAELKELVECMRQLVEITNKEASPVSADIDSIFMPVIRASISILVNNIKNRPEGSKATQDELRATITVLRVFNEKYITEADKNLLKDALVPKTKSS